jgi:hypothetical protein
MTNTMHIFGQSCPHDEVYIVGDREALEALRRAIERALGDNRSHSVSFTNDGEGYDVHVIQADAATADNLMLPYTDPIYEERYPDLKVKHWLLHKPQGSSTKGK